jgi:hypothetical protein
VFWNKFSLCLSLYWPNLIYHFVSFLLCIGVQLGQLKWLGIFEDRLLRWTFEMSRQEVQQHNLTSRHRPLQYVYRWLLSILKANRIFLVPEVTINKQFSTTKLCRVFFGKCTAVCTFLIHSKNSTWPEHYIIYLLLGITCFPQLAYAIPVSGILLMTNLFGMTSPEVSQECEIWGFHGSNSGTAGNVHM